MTKSYEHTVGIVGAGPLGSALAALFDRHGVNVVIGGPGPRRVWAPMPGTTVRTGTQSEAMESEIVVLAVPWQDVALVLSEIPDWEGRILVDGTNLTVDGADRGQDAGRSTALVASLANGAQVVKCFNSLPAQTLARGGGAIGGRRVLFLSGDHRRARDEVARLVRHLGFAAIDLGTLVEGARLQAPGGALFGLDLVQSELS